MNLRELVNSTGLSVPEAMESIPVLGLQIDSRRVVPGDIFLALRGSRTDGGAFIAEAARRGAAAILSESGSPAEDVAPTPIAVYPELRDFVGPLFDARHGFPSRRLEAFAVTGTNGKSTTVRLMTGILRAAGRKVISLGTIRYEIGDEILGSDLTTPATDAFFEILARGVAQGCDALAMEVSSHALSQDRIKGVHFRSAVFTNLTQDHLDYHQGFEDYFAAKKKLFTEYLQPNGISVVNLDTPYGKRLLAEWTGPRVTFSRIDDKADVTLKHEDLSLSGTRLVLVHQGKEFEIRSPLVGALNVENLLAAAAFGFSIGLDPSLIAAGVAAVTVPGRAEVIQLPAGGFAVVDYAHTPDALERILMSLRPLTRGRLSCVFGCGGDRDRQKRPLMGGIAERLADRVVLTSDNPRSEKPGDILAQIRSGMKGNEVEVVEDRQAAIRAALNGMGTDDCVLVAGKGHENYQIIGATRRHFSDQEEIAAWSNAGKGAVRREAGTWN